MNYLSQKNQTDLQSEKFKPYLLKIKDDKELMQVFMAKLIAAKQNKEVVSDEKVEQMETNSNEVSHKRLKGALYLLDRGSKTSHKQSYLFNGHRAETCLKMWPLILRVRCDKKSINTKINEIMKVIIETYTTIEFKNVINQGLVLN